MYQGCSRKYIGFGTFCICVVMDLVCTYLPKRISKRGVLKFYQVRIKMQGSPEPRLRLAHCTSQVKRWSKAMDFLPILLQNKYFLSCILEKYIVKGQCSIRKNKLSTKNGVATKFIANFCLCSIRKKKLSPKNGVVLKYIANVRFFLLVYT